MVVAFFLERNMFLPTTKKEMQERGWRQLDIIIVSGDAYVDHPSFGAAIIGRYLESYGYRVGIIPQPRWDTDKDFLALGKPKLFFGVTAGNMDSIVNHYTAQRKRRSSDAYSPDGQIGLRPNLPSIIYTQKLKEIFHDVPIILGGMEASMRRLPHYDYYSDKLRNSILFDSKADLLVYGMGERTILEIAHQLASEKKISELTNIRGTVYISKNKECDCEMPAYHKGFSNEEFLLAGQIFERRFRESKICQEFAGRYLIHNPPSLPLNSKEMDEVYALPFERVPHPKYKNKKLTAYDQILNSVTSHRGCFGGCSFCAIGYHQGKTISSRSQESIVNEISEITGSEGFHGTISDVGGPSANMYGMYCKAGISTTCLRRSCLYPDICKNLAHSHKKILDLLENCRKVDGVKNLFIGSGVRFDLALNEDKYIKVLAERHTSGLLKLAPEHIDDKTLQVMNKPSFELYKKFGKKYATATKRVHKNQTIVPYMIVGHPGTDINAAIELALYLKRNNIRLKQIQEFTPTPMTESTLAYVTGTTLEGEKIYVPKGREIRLQKALVQWFEPNNRKLIIEALKMAGRLDLKETFLSGKFVNNSISKNKSAKNKNNIRRKRNN